MLTSVATLALFWLSSLQSVTGAAVGEVSQNIRHGDPETVDAVGRALRFAGPAGNKGKEITYRMKKTELEKSWDHATLFALGSKYGLPTLDEKEMIAHWHTAVSLTPISQSFAKPAT
jgi:hypothetical protein